MMRAEDISRQNLDAVLKCFAKNYRKFCGKAPAEIVIVGGGSIVINYGFRTRTQDLDVLSKGPSGIRDAIIATANDIGLSEDWMNSDFRFLSSYSAKLYEASRHYRTLNNGTLEFRTVSAEYLIAMKMKSGREFSNDVPDIIGILASERERGNGIPYQEILDAGYFLYPDFESQISDSLQKRVQRYCRMTAPQLRTEYHKAVSIADNIAANIVQSENATQSKESAKQAGVQAERQLNQEWSDQDILAFFQQKDTAAAPNHQIQAMESLWTEYFSSPKETRNGIWWEERRLRPAVFEDKYLALCEQEGCSPDQTIKEHFWKNCVALQGYMPKYCKNARLSR